MALSGSALRCAAGNVGKEYHRLGLPLIAGNNGKVTEKSCEFIEKGGGIYQRAWADAPSDPLLCYGQQRR
jgi:hypothetical protein